MNKIAYDLDGVLIPDCDKIPQIGGLSDYYALTFYMRPIFRPAQQWNIVTARNPKYRSETMLWIEKHFANKPQRVWHEIGDGQSPEEYKAEIITQNGIELFVESDANIVDYLRKNTTATIVHFDTFCAKQFSV